MISPAHHWLRSLPHLAGLIAFSASGAAQQDSLPPFTDSAVDEVERYLEMRLSEVGVPGLATAIVHDGEIVLALELGEASPGIAMTAATPLFIASLSKSITAMALMQQVEAELRHLIKKRPQPSLSASGSPDEPLVRTLWARSAAQFHRHPGPEEPGLSVISQPGLSAVETKPKTPQVLVGADALAQLFEVVTGMHNPPGEFIGFTGDYPFHQGDG